MEAGVKLKGIVVKGLKMNKSGRIETVVRYASVSARIAAKKSKRVRVSKSPR